MMELCSGAKDIGAFMAMMSAGGAKDSGAFTRGAHNGYLPLASSIEYEGIYNEFYFDIGREREKLFAPKYSYCKSTDPFSRVSEHYLVVGLASKYDGDGIQIHGRNPFNLVIAVDISGSMSGKLGTSEDTRTKMEITVNSVISIISLLKPGDRFGCVTFNDDVTVVQDLELVENIKIPQLKQKILGLKPSGGTALSAALKKSTRLFDEVKKDETRYKASENTIFVMTDLVPTKDASTATFINTVRKNATDRLYTSIIGIGAEFGSDILKQLGKIRACNYFTVYSAQDFKRIIDRDFVYILSPIAFNITLSVNSDQFAVERVYGSPGNEIPSESGAMMSIECVSPSAVDETDRIKGGIVLAKLKPTGASSLSGVLKCRLQFEDRNGDIHVDEQNVEVPSAAEPNFYQGEAGRKSVLLTRYVNISKHWILDETRRYLASEKEDVCDANGESIDYSPTITKETGITPPPINQGATAKKRTPYYVDAHYSSLMSEFVAYYQSEIPEIGDSHLESYVLPLQKIADSKQTNFETAEKAAELGGVEDIEALYKPGLTIPPNRASAILQDIAQLGKWKLMQNLWGALKLVDQNAVANAIGGASANGHPKILKQLLELASQNFKLTQDQIANPILASAKGGHVECIQLLLSTFPDFDLNGKHAENALKTAYEFGKSKCAKFLIEKGAQGVTLDDIKRDLELGTKSAKNELDLVFCCDCTGSMGSYLESAQNSIRNIVQAIAVQGECDIRFGLVKYRDHPPQDTSYVTEEHDFTYEMKRMKAYVDTMSASGGGDGPECLVDGMESCLNMDWRPNATKIVCIITDAPPHGLFDNIGDGFPAGCPCGHDPLDVARKMASRSIVLYSLGVSARPVLKDFLTAIAQITEGQFVALSDASVLKDVIVGGSIEELDLKRVEQKVKEEMEALKGLGLDEDDTLLRITENLQKQNVKVKQMTLTNDSQDNTAVSIMVGANNLEEAANQLKTLDYKNAKAPAGKPAKFVVEEKVISMKQVARIWNRLNFHSA
eukprot:Phypoly_transcript_01505.p1 GENE.Phypoly_transcript_01505~~Phypoly_transcript_01505.p1  ORF type:complete len:1013 (+),score=195.00 Phypoly_transcript_01505:247-3285(+)